MIALPQRGGSVPSDSIAASFWQSRMTKAGKLAPLPQVIDVPSFARQLACMGDGCGRPASPGLPASQAVESSVAASFAQNMLPSGTMP